MTSTEDHLRVRKAKITDKIVAEVLDAWLKYVGTLSVEERAQLQTLDGTKLNEKLREAYTTAKTEKVEPPLTGWKLTAPSQAAEKEVRGSRVDKQKSDERATFLLAVNAFLAPAAVAAGGGAYLYRNVGSPVTPAMVIEQDCYRGAVVMADHVAVLTRIFRNNPDGVIEGYVRSNEMFAPTGQQIACMSMCTNPNDSLGRSPEWKFACPAPALQVVPAATIALDLGVTALQSTGLQATSWSVRTDTGAIAGATIVALVCTGRANEHIFLTHIPLGAGFAFRRYQGEEYQCQWKILNNLTAYTQLASTHNMEI
jgi:hypothetical protein